MLNDAWLIPLFPLIAFVLLVGLGRDYGNLRQCRDPGDCSLHW